MIRRPPRSTLSSSSAASDVYKRQYQRRVRENVVQWKSSSEHSRMISFRHSFGVKPSVNDGVAYISDTDVVYPCGRTIVVHDTEQNHQRFLPGADTLSDIACMAISPSLKLAAIADKGTEHPSLAVFDLTTLKRRRHFSCADMLSQEYVSLSFSADSRLLLAQGGAPDFTLALWQWEKSRPVCVGRIAAGPEQPVLEASLCPYNSSVCCAVGEACCKFLRNVDGSWKPVGGLGRRDVDDCTSHCWLAGERCIVATAQGGLLLFESFEFRAELPQAEGGRASIQKLVPYKRGFLCATADGVVRVFDRSPERLEYFTQVHSVSPEAWSPSDQIVSLCVSPNNDNMLLSVNQGTTAQLLSLPFASFEYSKGQPLPFDHLGASLHSREVTGLDVCSGKPLIATSSTDRTVRLWDYLERTLVLCKEFSEDSLSVAIHPSSYFLLVGFSDKLRLLSVLMDELRPVREFAIKSCRCASFAAGGHVFAVAHNNNVQVYDTYSGALQYNMRGHSARVKSLFFAQRDHLLYSAGMDGGVHQWSTVDGTRSAEVGSVMKSCNYNTVIADSAGKVICAGHDNRLRVYVGTQIDMELETSSPITRLCLSKSERQLYAGCWDGKINVYIYPLTGEYEEHSLHTAPVTGLKMSIDDTMVFTSAADGSVDMFDVNDREARREKKEIQWFQEILVGRGELDEKAAAMKEAEGRVKALISQNEYTAKINAKVHEDSTKQMHTSFEAELAKERARYDYLVSEKNDMEMDFEEKLRHMEERRTTSMQELEATYETQLLKQGKELRRVLGEKEHDALKYEEQHEMLVEQHDRLLSDVQDDFEVRISEQDKVIEHLGDDGEEQQQVLETMRVMIEQDCDLEILNTKLGFDKRLEREKENLLLLKGDNGLVKKKNIQLQKQFDEQEARIRAVTDRAEELESKLEIAKRSIVGLQSENKEREVAIAEKEKRIYELKKKNQELEKFKFVLDYKIKELRKQIEPKEFEIQGMKETVTEMDAELDRYNKINQALDLDNCSLQSKLEATQKQCVRQRAEISEAANATKKFRADLEETVPVSYTHLRAHETVLDLVCRLLLEKKKNNRIR
eukprot:TRINITY_DN1637_c0_g1_i2.p1 TRINITY_DN1637_c0_g1~~TRINITY_DN1637_c0_g1_i2.p1  ORF type:complete len:1081 (+),score=255.42 TRINITY_DN1637_c0_g1_i2:111-3353(+)